jgi:hypothetical protein
VAAGANRHEKIAFTRVADGGRNVGLVDALRDECRFAIDRAVPDQPGIIVSAIAGSEHAPAKS